MSKVLIKSKFDRFKPGKVPVSVLQDLVEKYDSGVVNDGDVVGFLKAHLKYDEERPIVMFEFNAVSIFIAQIRRLLSELNKPVPLSGPLTRESLFVWAVDHAAKNPTYIDVQFNPITNENETSPEPNDAARVLARVSLRYKLSTACSLALSRAFWDGTPAIKHFGVNQSLDELQKLGAFATPMPLSDFLGKYGES